MDISIPFKLLVLEKKKDGQGTENHTQGIKKGLYMTFDLFFKVKSRLFW
jgi:hypothetical protein